MPPSAPRRPRLVTPVFFTVLLGLFVVALWRPAPVVELAAHLPWTLERIVLQPRTYCAIAAILLLERLLPAAPTQGVVNRGTLQDVLYFVVNSPLVIALLIPYMAFLERLFREHLDFLVLDAGQALPYWLVVTLSFLIGDFLAWFHHLVRHKVPFFWRLHAIHHSQREMNLFTDARSHPLDVFVAQSLIVLPLFVLGAHLRGRIEELAFLAFLLTWFPRLYHANVRMGLGPLRYVLVTPRSHRVHHSMRPEHLDKNFGVILSVWDRLFGTHVDDGTYPETGVADPLLERGPEVSMGAAVRSFLKDLAYPFRGSGRSA